MIGTGKVKVTVPQVLLIVAIVAMVALMTKAQGCAWSRDTAERVSTEDVANTNTLRFIGGNIIATWDTKSGVLKMYLGPSLDDVSKTEIKKVIEGLDALSKIKETKVGITNWNKGEAVGYTIRLYRLLGEDVFKDVLPRIMALIDPLL